MRKPSLPLPNSKAGRRALLIAFLTTLCVVIRILISALTGEPAK